MLLKIQIFDVLSINMFIMCIEASTEVKRSNEQQKTISKSIY